MASRLLPATSGHGRELCQAVGEASEPVQATGSEQEWIDLVQIPALGPELVTLGKAPNSRVSVLSNPKEGYHHLPLRDVKSRKHGEKPLAQGLVMSQLHIVESSSLLLK